MARGVVSSGDRSACLNDTRMCLLEDPAVASDPDGNGVPFSLAVRFPGQYADAETGWHYNMFRTFDPATGRFIEPDPIGMEGGLIRACAGAWALPLP